MRRDLIIKEGECIAVGAGKRGGETDEKNSRTF